MCLCICSESLVASLLLVWWKVPWKRVWVGIKGSLSVEGVGWFVEREICFLGSSELNWSLIVKSNSWLYPFLRFMEIEVQPQEYRQTPGPFILLFHSVLWALDMLVLPLLKLRLQPMDSGPTWCSSVQAQKFHLNRSLHSQYLDPCPKVGTFVECPGWVWHLNGYHKWGPLSFELHLLKLVTALPDMMLQRQPKRQKSKYWRMFGPCQEQVLRMWTTISKADRSCWKCVVLSDDGFIFSRSVVCLRDSLLPFLLILWWLNW